MAGACSVFPWEVFFTCLGALGVLSQVPGKQTESNEAAKFSHDLFTDAVPHEAISQLMQTQRNTILVLYMSRTALRLRNTVSEQCNLKFERSTEGTNISIVKSR